MDGQREGTDASGDGGSTGAQPTDGASVFDVAPKPPPKPPGTLVDEDSTESGGDMTSSSMDAPAPPPVKGGGT